MACILLTILFLCHTHTCPKAGTDEGISRILTMKKTIYIYDNEQNTKSCSDSGEQGTGESGLIQVSYLGSIVDKEEETEAGAIARIQ